MYLIQGMLIGLLFGIPIGTVGILTMKRTLEYGPWAGFVSGIGCSVADLLYACISIFGVTFLRDFMMYYEMPIRLLGGGLIMIMGVISLLKEQVVVEENKKATRYVSFFLSSFTIAFTNPATILTFIIAFSLFGIEQVSSIGDGIGVISGIFLGTCIWWSLIAVG